MQKSRNSTLQQAKDSKNDEFYTQLQDIEKELMHYRNFFKGKTVFCNCDDPYESNFLKYFAINFNALKLKKLIATGYSTSSIAYTQLDLFGFKDLKDKKRKAYKIEIEEMYDINNDGSEDLEDIKILLQQGTGKNKLTLLDGDGDFRSNESIELLKEADVVVTNPPFSLFRDYVAQLIRYNKKFIILGNMNAITYKEIFPLIKDNKLWIGYGFNMSMVYKTKYPNLLEANRKFVISKGYDPDEGFLKVPAICWYTNIDTKKRHDELILYKKYSPQEYPEYDNYKAINVNKISEIPSDYDGLIGVPITFIDKYNPDQFEIMASDYQIKEGEFPEAIKKSRTGKNDRGYINGERIYARILIRKKPKSGK